MGRFLIILSWLAFWMLGCAAGEKFAGRPVEFQVPAQWEGGDAAPAAPEAWLADFADPGLTAAVLAALKANPDLLAAAQNAARARAEVRAADSGRWPEIRMRSGVHREEIVSEQDGQVWKSRERQGDLRGELAWEVDLWHRIRTLKDAAEAESEAVGLDYRSARLSYAAKTAKAWLGAVAASLQVRLSQTACTASRQSTEVLARRFQSGLASAMDLGLMQSQTLAACDDVTRLRQERDRAIRNLNVLMGQYPSSRHALPDQLPLVQRPIPAGIPAELLARRPDIAAARQRILSCDLKTLAAEKSLLPALSLTASGGSASPDFVNLLDAARSVWGLGAGLTQPLFQGGRLAAEVQKGSLAAREAFYAYESRVLTAFQEVEEALGAAEALKQREQEVAALVREARSALDKSWDAYLAGESEIVAVLEAQQTAIRAEKDLLSVSEAALVNRVNFYLALGGDVK